MSKKIVLTETEQKLYNVCYWLNSQSKDSYPLDDDAETRRDIKKALQTVGNDVEAFMAIPYNFDIYNPNEKSEIDGMTLKEVAEGLAMRILQGAEKEKKVQ